MEKDAERGLDWAGRPVIATVARLLRWEFTTDGALTTSDRHPGPSLRCRATPRQRPPSHRRTGAHPFRAAPVSYRTARPLAVTPLTQRLTDEDDNVRNAAKRALDEIHRRELGLTDCPDGARKREELARPQ